MKFAAGRILRHYFIPHESNNYKARSLQPTALIFYIIVIFAFQIIVPITKQVGPSVLGYATNITVEQILDLVNKEREKAGLAPLSLSKELSTAATKKAADMFANNYWAHVSPTGITPWDFITSSGYNYLYAGENLAKDFSTSEEVVQAWMRSPTHRANILKPEYKDIGLAVMNGSLLNSDTTLVVQEFGSKINDSLAKETILPTLPAVQSQSVADVSLIESTSQKPVIYSFKISKTFSQIIAEFLLIVLLIDAFYIWRTRTMRLSGHTLAHIIFLGSLIGAMGATGIGVIL